jgi:hypothetical protein
MRVALLSLIILAGACGEGPTEAHPIYLELGVHDGLPERPCAASGFFDGISTRDVKRTAVAREESAGKVGCVVPVDATRERFLLHAVGCALDGGDEALVELTAQAVDGGRAVPITFELSLTQRASVRTFGPGLPLMVDLELGGRGEAACWLSGTYVRTTDAARLWGPYRVVSHSGTFTPNPDRR